MNSEIRVLDLREEREPGGGPAVAVQGAGHIPASLADRLTGRGPASDAVCAPITPFRKAKSATQRVVHIVDNHDVTSFTSVAAAFGQSGYAYAVTPNVDHLIRCHEDPVFQDLYGSAAYVLMDSRFLAKMLRLLTGTRLRVCTGADLTVNLLSKVVTPTDRILVIGGTPRRVEQLAAKYNVSVRHHNPPMGFIKDPEAVAACLEFIERESPFRFCFLAVGSPQQEMIAQLLQKRGVARGLTLCIGASLNYLTGVEKRAPEWVQRIAFEWLYRLLRNPRRLAHRYLVRGPRIFNHLRRAQFVLR